MHAGETETRIFSCLHFSGNSLWLHKDLPFSTKDVDHDACLTESCSNKFHGAWWYNCCHKANLNALYYKKDEAPERAIGVTWEAWMGQRISLKSTSMKTRPVGFTPGEDCMSHIRVTWGMQPQLIVLYK